MEESVVRILMACQRFIISQRAAFPKALGTGAVFTAVDWTLFISGMSFAGDLNCLFCLAAIIEHVRDGSVVRALLLPDYYLVTVMLSGIKVRPSMDCVWGVGLGFVEVFSHR